MIIPASTVKDLPFDQRYAIGNKIERYVLDIIKKSTDPTAYIKLGLDKSGDIYSPKYNCLLEVKSQPDAVYCVSVELGRGSKENRRPSGITTSTSSYYVWHCHHKLMIIKTSKLREIIENIPETEHPLHGETYFLKILNIKTLEANCVKILEADI